MTAASKTASRSLSVRSFTLLMLFLLAGFFFSSTNAFRPLTLLPSLQVSAPGAQRSRVLVVLWSSNSVDEDDAAEHKPPRDETEASSSSHNHRLWKQVQAVNDQFWDYTCNFLYVAISCLILLNLCGYAYTITAEEGLNVMPIAEYRQERQWDEEIMKLQRSPVSPALQSAPAAFLLQQQTK